MSSKERLMTVLLAPHVSEKSARVAERQNQVVFRVLRDASKPEIKAAVELMFEVARQDGLALLLVTHDEELARRCKRTVRMKDGRVVG